MTTPDSPAAGRPTLYTTALSANGRKPLLLDHCLGLGLRIETIDVYAGEGRRAEYLALNPWGKVPTLVDGDLVLWESNAILIYLAERYGADRLWSRDPVRRADVARWLFWESSTWQPALVTVLAEPVGRLLRGEAGGGESTADWDDPGLLPLLRHLDLHLSTRSSLVGNELTLADLSVAAMAMYLSPLAFPSRRFPAFGRWLERLESRAEWRATAVGPFRVESRARD